LIFDIKDLFYRSTDFLYEDRAIVAMTWLILALSVILLVMQLAKKKDVPLQGVALGFFTVLFLSVCVLETCVFFCGMDSEMNRWFFDSDRVNWMWSIVGYILLAGVTVNQLLCLLEMLESMTANAGVVCNFRPGYISWLAAIAAYLVCELFDVYLGGIIFLALFVAQLIQIVIIFRAVLPRANFGTAAIHSFVYLLGTFGTAVILVMFIIISLVVAVIALVGYIAYGFLTAPPAKKTFDTRSCRTCRHYPGDGNFCEGGNRRVDAYGCDQAGHCGGWS
jgi:hypothetical protein